MKKILTLIATVFLAIGAFAQKSVPQRLEIATIDVEQTGTSLEVFYMPKDSINHYYLSVGHPGFGDDIIQLQIDPVSELFIPLGDSLDDAIEFLKQLQALYKGEVGDSIEVDACISVLFPDESKFEKATVTLIKPLLTRTLEFSISRKGYSRASHVPKSDFNSIVSSTKFVRKLRPKLK